VCEPEAPLSGARFVGKVGKVGKVACRSLIRFTFEGNSILDMWPSRSVRIERQKGLDLFSPIAFSLSRRRSAGCNLTLALNLETSFTDHDITDWLYPAGVRNHTWVGARLSCFPNRVPALLPSALFHESDFVAQKAACRSRARLGDQASLSCRDPLSMFDGSRPSAEDQNLLSYFIAVNRCRKPTTFSSQITF